MLFRGAKAQDGGNLATVVRYNANHHGLCNLNREVAPFIGMVAPCFIVGSAELPPKSFEILFCIESFSSFPPPTPKSADFAAIFAF